MTGCPSCLPALSAMPRNKRSALTPAWNGTMRVIGRDGNSPAWPKAAAVIPTQPAAAAASASHARRCMLVLLLEPPGSLARLGRGRLAYFGERATASGSLALVSAAAGGRPGFKTAYP